MEGALVAEVGGEGRAQGPTSTPIATLRIAVEAITDRVRKHEEQLRRLAAHND